MRVKELVLPGWVKWGVCLMLVSLCIGVIPAWSSDDVHGNKKTDPIWDRTVDHIETQLLHALDVYKQGDVQKASDLVVKVQFDLYKNTLLETAVRKFVSQQKDYENNAAFTHLIAAVKERQSHEKIAQRMKALVKELRHDILDLPIIKGAVSEKEIQRVKTQKIVNQDWSQISQQFSRQMQGLLQMYKDNNAEGACALLETIYIDLFEGSGMEGMMAKKDPEVLQRFTSSFSSLMGLMKEGAPFAEVEKTVGQMEIDFEKSSSSIKKEEGVLSFIPWYYWMVIGGVAIFLLMILQMTRKKKNI